MISLERAQLARAGFDDPDRALADLATLGPDARELAWSIATTADPDAALRGLVRLTEAAAEDPDLPPLIERLVDDEGWTMRLAAVMGMSRAMIDHLVRHPAHAWELADPDLSTTRPTAASLRADLHAAVAGKPRPQALNGLRVEYRRLLLRLMARDLADHLRIDDVAAELADLAAAALDAAVLIARDEVGERADAVSLAVIAMGKCGGRELNYVSDVDVVFVHEASGEGADENTAAGVAARIAAATMRACSEQTIEGSLWPVDANLRPEGSQGPLSRTIASHVGYFERWAKTWEFQALLKARPVAGDLELGERYRAAVDPLVWTAADRDGFVADARAMRRRVVDHLPRDEAARQLKLGEGGLRDVEFAVQLLQLVHGRTDESIRSSNTLKALAQLTDAGYVGREDGEDLGEAYRFLRTLEHSMQSHLLRRVHVVPTDEPSLRRLGRALGMRGDAATELERVWRQHRMEVRRLHEKLFYRPLLTAVGNIATDEVRLSSDAAAERMSALGYTDPAAALRHLEALTSGVSRTAAVQRALLPAMLEWLAEGADPDAGLFAFRRISEALGRTPWFLKTLRDEGASAQRLAFLLATSRYAADLLQTEPTGIKMLGDDLSPPEQGVLTKEIAAAAARHEKDTEAVRVIRGIRRRELLRLAAGEALGLTSIDEVGAGLSRLTDATLEATLSAVTRAECARRGLDEPPTAMAIIAMGRYGGFELSYASDADVMFVHDPRPGVDTHEATVFAKACANRLRELLSAPGDDPPLEIDADLRPEGRQGALVRTLDSYAAYYRSWSHVWEAQALLRADAVVGDEDLRGRFTALIDPIRYPEAGASDADVMEIRRIKGRVDRERLPKGADPSRHLKLGSGGLADIEWTIQLLQLRHAGTCEGLRTPRTAVAMAAAAEAGLISADDADCLMTSWRLASRIRNATTLVRGKPEDVLPGDGLTLTGMAAVLGYREGHTDELTNDYLRATRRARHVVERVFWE